MNESGAERVIVVRSDYGLPYSKGLMAQSIMAAGLTPERAHALAAQIERRLHERNDNEIDVEDLRALVEELLLAEESELVAKRFNQWWGLGLLSRPLLVLLGGVTGVGKSTVATALANRLGITRVIATDQVRQVVRAFFSHDFMPAVHHSSFNVARKLSSLPDDDDSATVAGFLRQVHDIAPGVDALVQRAIDERTPMVLEGIHLLPDIPEAELCDQTIAVRAVLAVTDEQEHRAHFMVRGETTPRMPQRYLDGFDRIRALQDYLLERAAEADVPVIDEGAFEPTIKRVMEVVLDAVVEAEQRPQQPPPAASS